MNDSIDTNSDLRDLIAVDFRELYLPYDSAHFDIEAEEMAAEKRLEDLQYMTMSDIIDG